MSNDMGGSREDHGFNLLTQPRRTNRKRLPSPPIRKVPPRCVHQRTPQAHHSTQGDRLERKESFRFGIYQEEIGLERFENPSKAGVEVAMRLSGKGQIRWNNAKSAFFGLASGDQFLFTPYPRSEDRKLQIMQRLQPAIEFPSFGAYGVMVNNEYLHVTSPFVDSQNLSDGRQDSFHCNGMHTFMCPEGTQSDGPRQYRANHS